MKRSSTLLITREMQIKTTMRYHLTPVRMVITKKSTTINAGGDAERKGNPPGLLVGMEIDTAGIEDTMEIPLKTRNKTTI